jgi:hypothetical protein
MRKGTDGVLEYIDKGQWLGKRVKHDIYFNLKSESSSKRIIILNRLVVDLHRNLQNASGWTRILETRENRLSNDFTPCIGRLVGFSSYKPDVRGVAAGVTWAFECRMIQNTPVASPFLGSGLCSGGFSVSMTVK